MPLVFASIVPHSPITIPSIGKEKSETIVKTLAGVKELEGELYVMQPDTLFVISPHAPTAETSFSVNLAPEFTADFREFGDMEINLRFPCDIELISKIREYADSHNSSLVNVISQTNLDYGSAVALYLLTKHVPKVKIVPISVSLLDAKAHYEFGAMLRSVAMQTNKRVAIIASTELAHNIGDASADGYHPDSKTFDSKIQEMVTTGDLATILKLNSALVENAQAVGALKTLSMVFGAIDGMGHDARILSYERPLGFGLLIAEFNLI